MILLASIRYCRDTPRKTLMKRRCVGQYTLNINARMVLSFVGIGKLKERNNVDTH